MATFKLYKLHFTTPLHISDQHEEGDVSQKTIHSDTLYAALMSCLAKTGHTIPDNGDLGFTISDLFPYYQAEENSKPVYFLPMPLQTRLPDIDLKEAKKVKKVQWVDASLYGKVLSGESLFDSEGGHLSDIQASYLIAQKLPVDIDGDKEFVRSEVAQRVTIKDRTGQEDAKPYFVDRIFFRDYAGLYFLAEGDTDLLEKALNMLAIEGIGSDRNVGFGFFEYKPGTMELELPQDADHQVCLSLFIPESEQQLKEMLDSDRVAYDFMRRGGWITTAPYMTLRKNAIYAFLPGSVFRKVGEDACKGKIVNLKPEIGEASPQHPVWRSGRAMMLPIKY